MILGDVNPPGDVAFEKNLGDVLNKIQEGKKGMDPRHVARVWFAKAVHMARATPEKTLTLNIIRNAFIDVLQGDDKETFLTHKETDAQTWLYIADEVAKEVILPRIRNDVMGAMAAGEASIDIEYRRTMMMFAALGSSENSKQFMDPVSGDFKKIDMEYLKVIIKLYEKQNHGRTIEPAEITNFHSTASEGSMHLGLKAAIQQYHARSNTPELSRLARVLREGTDDQERKDQSIKFLESLRKLYGYNLAAAVSSLEFLAEWENREKEGELQGGPNP